MYINDLFTIQQDLDTRIEENIALPTKDLYQKRVLALLVEIGECANEWQGFKYWKQNKTTNNEKILEEYVDILHFALSLGIMLKKTYVEHIEPLMCDTLTEQFNELYKQGSGFLDQGFHYATFLRYFIGLGVMLGFDSDTIRHAYLDKNQTNHDRQTQAY